MGWEVRNGRRYYYDAKKVDGKVVKTYMGREQDGVNFTEFSDMVRDYRGIEAMLRLIERRRWLHVETAVEDFCERVRIVVNSVLTEAGYHRHDRGAWRKRRINRPNLPDERDGSEEMNKDTGMETKQKRARVKTGGASQSASETVLASTAAAKSEEATSDVAPDYEIDPELNEQINEIRREVEEKGIEKVLAELAASQEAAIERAAKGDESARTTVRRIIERMTTGQNSETFTEIADRTLDDVLRGCWGENILAAEIARKEALDYRKALLGSSPSPLEKLLVDQVVICWLQSNFHARMYASVTQELRADQHKIFQERLDRAQRGLLHATKTLAQVRKLQLPLPPSYQVNIASNGGQQINPAGGIAINSHADSLAEPAPEDHATVRRGAAIWRNTEVDMPIEVTGGLGEENGREYVRIAGSVTGIPVDEIIYESAVAVNTPD